MEYEARQSEWDATLHAGWRQVFSSWTKTRVLKDQSKLFPLRQETKP